MRTRLLGKLGGAAQVQLRRFRHRHVLLGRADVVSVGRVLDIARNCNAYERPYDDNLIEGSRSLALLPSPSIDDAPPR